MKDKTLSDTLKEITYGLVPDYDPYHALPRRDKAVRGPSKWLEIHDDANAYGKDFDFRIMDRDVFMPTCRAAQEWVYYSFAPDNDYYTDIDGWVGVRVTSRMEDVIESARKVGLLGEEEYEEAMLNEQIIHQGEQQ